MAATIAASGARFGRTRMAAPTSAPQASGRATIASAASHSAAVAMSFIGCTAWYSTIGLDAVSMAADTPARPPAIRLASTNAHHTSTNPAIGVTANIASRPPTA